MLRRIVAPDKRAMMPLLIGSMLVFCNHLLAQSEDTDPSKNWSFERLDGGSLARRTLHLVPAAEPNPALRLRLVPGGQEAEQGNAAMSYLKAMGFLEHTQQRIAVEEFILSERAKISESARGQTASPPDAWYELWPQVIPVNQVDEYLKLLDFQTRFLDDANRRTHCDFGRHIGETDEPYWAYLLPEIQQCRELARTQRLRFLVALAKGDVDAAVKVFGQQLTLGYHIGQDDFLVSSLVGIACANIGFYDAYFLCEANESPNMYWAMAALPNPLVSIAKPVELELSQALGLRSELEQLTLTESNLTQTRVLLANLQDAIQQLGDSQNNQIALPLAIANSYPEAVDYLVSRCGEDPNVLDDLPRSQVWLVAVSRLNAEIADQYRMVFLVDETRRLDRASACEKMLNSMSERYGPLTMVSKLVLPAIRVSVIAEFRTKQQRALLQTVESIRHHLAVSKGRLPKSLDDLDLPAINDPVTGQPFEYSCSGDQAILRSASLPNFRTELTLHVKDASQ